jgi:hypothetical protein
MKHDYNEMLSQIAETIGKFLKKEGGMNNGYETYVKGYVVSNTQQSLTFKTPKTNDLKGSELDKRGYELNEKLTKILRAYEYKGDVKISSTHMEHGCYEIEVSFKTSTIVNIPF